MNVTLPDFTQATVLVVGDLMLDRYWDGDTARISPEAPVPVVHVKQVSDHLGGAGNVALNLMSLGVNTHLVAAVGCDAAGQTLQSILDNTQLHCHLSMQEDMETTTKLRVLSRHQQLIRLDFESSLPNCHAQAVNDLALAQLPLAKVVILSDYGKGALAGKTALIKAIRAQGIPILIDPKSTDFSHYHGASVITPNYTEFEAAVGKCYNDTDLVEKAQNLLRTHDIQSLLITRSSDGMTLIEQDKPPLHLPAHAKDVFDVTGAGDTVIALLAAGIAAGFDKQTAAKLANVAAGIVVGKSGAATVTVPELRVTLRQYGHDDAGVLTQTQLLTAVQRAKAQGEKIVMTNGCFDLLHAGHVTYLQQAKALGHRLIVAVNDDGSVKQLKGVGRPVNPVARRMAVLSALGVVDWVVPFSELTPEDLITQVLPDCLVKGGDYQIEQIAGARAVLQNGGEVKILPFVQGCSSTQMIEHIYTRGKAQ